MDKQTTYSNKFSLKAQHKPPVAAEYLRCDGERIGAGSMFEGCCRGLKYRGKRAGRRRELEQRDESDAYDDERVDCCSDIYDSRAKLRCSDESLKLSRGMFVSLGVLLSIVLMGAQAVSAQTASTFTGKTWSQFMGGAKAVCDNNTANNNNDNDIDNDNDGLIEVCFVEDLDAIRYALDGSGYRASGSATTRTTGCPSTGCIGYELVRDLDFTDNNSYRNASANKTKWTTTATGGWQPIGSEGNPFAGIFEGNGHTISHLTIHKPDDNLIGLFSVVASEKIINGLGLLNATVTGETAVGILVGRNEGTISNSFSTGHTQGLAQFTTTVGGLSGSNNGAIINSYSTAAVSGNNIMGGLIGHITSGMVSNTYSTGQVTGTSINLGGFAGEISRGTISNCYSIGKVISNSQHISGFIHAGRPANIKISNSYWDKTASELATSTFGEGKTTTELQSPTDNTTGIYSAWSENDWDFGTATQYPALKYTTGTNANYLTCGISQQPPCGSLLAGQKTRLIVVSTATSITVQAVEDETVTLDATRSGTNLTYVWEQTDGRDVSYLSTTDSAMLRFLVPLNVASGGATATGVLMFHLTVNDDSAATVSIVVYDDSDDGSITTPTITRLPAGRMAVSVNLASDPDGAGKIEAYQWQICSTTCSQWQNASGASTNSSYQIPTAEVAENNQFRVQLTYRDGQNFQRTLLSTSLFYINQKPMITDIDPITTTEGEVVTLVAKASDADFDNLNYIWRVTTGDKTTSILVASTVTNAILVFTVPKVWTNTTQATLSLSISVSDGATTSTKPVVVNIARADNGGLTTTTPTITEVEQKLTVSPISAAALATDPDGAGTIEAYQWQICLAGEDCKQESQWKDISGATSNSYQISKVEAVGGNQFRMQINYRDGQGYRRTITSKVFSYPQKAIFMRLKLFLEGALQ